VIAEVRASGVATLSGIAKAFYGAWRADTERARDLKSATVMRLDRRVEAPLMPPGRLGVRSASRGLTLIADPPTPRGWHYLAPHTRHRRPWIFRGGVFDETD
jgi:hypothetical protein